MRYIDDSRTNADVINNDFIIFFKVYTVVLNIDIIYFLKAITSVLNSGFIILKNIKIMLLPTFEIVQIDFKDYV